MTYTLWWRSGGHARFAWRRVLEAFASPQAAHDYAVERLVAQGYPCVVRKADEPTPSVFRPEDML